MTKVKVKVVGSGESIEEIEANYFAMCLLMPREFLLKDLAKTPVELTDDAAIARLAKKYKVGTGVMAMRIGQLQEEARALASLSPAAPEAKGGEA